MSTQLTPFYDEDEHELRTVIIDGEPWFLLSDLCAALGIVNVGNVLARLAVDEKSYIRLADGTPGNPNRGVVNESGLYSVILRSDAPGAEAFRRWVTRTVLPQIRRTGRYAGGLAALPQSHAEALRALADEVEAHEAAKARIGELEPPAQAWAQLVDAAGDYSVGDAAKMLSRDPAISIGQNALFRWMGKHRWAYQRGGSWHPYQDKVDDGLIVLRANRPYHNDRLDVDVLPAPTVRITAKGLQRLHSRLTGTTTLQEIQ